MSGSLPLCTPSGGGAILFSRDGRVQSGERAPRAVVLSSRMVVVITGRGGRLPWSWSDRRIGELIRSNHPEPLENLAFYKVKPGRGVCLIVVVDRSLLEEIRKVAGSGVALMLPVPKGTLELPHPDGSRERVSFTSTDGYQFQLVSRTAERERDFDRQPLRSELWEVFPDRHRRRERRFRLVLSIALALLIALPLAVLPWYSLREARESYLHAELEARRSIAASDERERRMEVLEEEYRHLLSLKQGRPPSLLQLLEEIYRVTPDGVGIEEITFEGGEFHVVLWSDLAQGLIERLKAGGRVSVASVMERGTEQVRGVTLRKLSISGRLDE